MRLSFLSLLVVSIYCSAQQQTFDMANTTVGSMGYVRFNNYAALGQKNDDKLDYSEIRGSCFWDSEWNPAILILKSGKGVKLNKVKLNFYSNSVHYLDDNGAELVAQNSLKNIVFFDRKDTLKLIAVFEGLAGFKIKDLDAYAQILADGQTKFLKRTEVTLVKKDNDPMLGHPDLKFVSDTHYYIEESGSIKRLKNISKESLFSIVKPTDEEEIWLKANKNKLKNEADIIGFMAYHNSVKK